MEDGVFNCANGCGSVIKAGQPGAVVMCFNEATNEIETHRLCWDCAPCKALETLKRGSFEKTTQKGLVNDGDNG